MEGYVAKRKSKIRFEVLLRLKVQKSCFSAIPEEPIPVQCASPNTNKHGLQSCEIFTFQWVGLVLKKEVPQI